ncbi:MAG: pirin family protein [Chitinophagales bacterium]|nr:pirin family protein [Chitinophagales bacterium]
MNKIVHKADARGFANHGWLKAAHSFSFANYYNPDKMGFGMLRVLNDDSIDGGEGFGMHPHKNMEIITIPLSGALEHKDSMGNSAVINQGDVQVMSAGTGIFHSEFNKNKDEPVKLLQIWVLPNQQNVTPRYQQLTLNVVDRKDKLQQIVSPDPQGEGVWIHQQAWFYLGDFSMDTQQQHTIKNEGNGVYLFVMEGSVKVNNEVLNRRDAIGLWNIHEAIDIVSLSSDTSILLMEVPMG